MPVSQRELLSVWKFLLFQKFKCVWKYKLTWTQRVVGKEKFMHWAPTDIRKETYLYIYPKQQYTDTVFL